jgi:hypothetical protein
MVIGSSTTPTPTVSDGLTFDADRIICLVFFPSIVLCDDFRMDIRGTEETSVGSGRRRLSNGQTFRRRKHVDFCQLHISHIVIALALQKDTPKVENNSVRKHREHDTIKPWGVDCQFQPNSKVLSDILT